jgi:two-component system sensor kinase FixL
VASISHEVNQPLYAIANFSAAIAAALDSAGTLPVAQLRHWNEEISKAASRAGEIIRRVRSYVTRGPTLRRPIDICAVVEESAALLKAEARRQRVQIQLDLVHPPAQLVADPVAIQQVLVNLLRNALEATADAPNHRRTVIVRTRLAKKDMEISVEDAGAGLSESDFAHLFSAFYTSKPHGMGLGLAISKTIIEAHHGHIRATRNTDHGSTFHFTLPLA